MRFAFLGFACLLSAQDFTEVQVEKATGNHRFTEGPVWSKSINGLLFCDVANNTIQAFLPGKGVGKFREEMGGASALAYAPDGTLLVTETKERRVVRLIPGEEKKMEVVIDNFDGKKFNGPNDIAIRRDGNIYFTDPAFGSQVDRRELDYSGIYNINPKGEVSLVAKPQGRPNGIAISANGRRLFVANADERRIYGYDLDGKGKATNEQVVLDKLDGAPAGIRLDEKGNFYIAANNVVIYSPQGKLLHTIHMTEKPSNLAFGDADHMTLFITAKTSIYRARMKVKGVVSESSQ